MSEPAALKEMFDAACYRRIAKEVAALHPAFDPARFLKLALRDLAPLSLTQRLRRMTESLHATLPSNYRRAVAILRKLAPRAGDGFVTLFLPDYVGLYGVEDFDFSMEALKFFTPFGSSEFAVRVFLRHDPARALAIMEKWSRDADEHVRRLASEGTRPRLPWSFRLDAFIDDPTRTAAILESLQADPSLYVRKSVANHLNDITKDHPTRIMDLLETWPMENAHTAWIVKRALRTLIKKGDRRALAIIGAGEKPRVAIHDLAVHPRHVTLGDRITLSFRLESQSRRPQRLMVDYIIHYVKKSGGTSRKVFKLKEITLAPRASFSIVRNQQIRDFTTRVHHPGLHAVEIMVNGEILGADSFELSR